MKKKKIFVALVLVYGFLNYNGYSEKVKEPNDISDVKILAKENVDFSFDLYDILKNDSNALAPKGNLFLSPYSISTALAMTYAGAERETKTQIANVFHFTLPKQNLYSAFDDLQKQLIQEDKSHGYQLLIANALWGQKGAPFLEEFIKLNNDYFGAGLRQLDFVYETEASRQIINSWIEEKTNKKIKNLIPSNAIEKETVLVLTDAIYFKGEWKTKFDKSKTKNSDFTISANQIIKVPLMNLKNNFKYYADEKFQAVELPYKGNEISMLVLLPNETESLKELEKNFTADTLNTVLSKMDEIIVDVYFPRFKMTWGSFSLNKSLIALGMPDAFNSEKADFSGINGKRGIWISNVFHKAFIEVNEEGTEAAAGTGVVIVKSFHVEPIFRADHPFIFIIKDNRSGSILFMGRLMNPSE
jgi:serpin B